jgi:hypothetical protein
MMLSRERINTLAAQLPLCSIFRPKSLASHPVAMTPTRWKSF